MEGQSNATPILNPNRVRVAASNAERIAKRRAAATLSANVGRATSASLSRGFNRTVGGQFQTIQDLPSATVPAARSGFTQSDVSRFLSAFQFAPQREVLSRSRSITGLSSRSGQFGVSFGGGGLSINSIIEASRRVRITDPRTGRPVSRRSQQGLFGGRISF